MCLKYGKSQPKRAYKARAYKIKKCTCFQGISGRFSQNGRTDERTNGRTDERTNRRTLIHSFVDTFKNMQLPYI